MTTRSRVIGLCCLALGAAGPAFADPTIITFDAPSAGTDFGEGTDVYGMDSDGDTVGVVTDSFQIVHGFLRLADGTFVNFSGSDSTFPDAIAKGARTTGISGSHAFIATADGTVSTFDVPGLTREQGGGINNKGVVVGYGYTEDDVMRGFLRKRSGKIKIFDAPGAGEGAGQGTLPARVAADGTICGIVFDDHTVRHGFLRSPTGEMTAFDPPGSVRTNCAGIGKDESVMGYYRDGGNVAHGYIRAPAGTYTTIDAPGAGTASNQGTTLVWSNPDGRATGAVIDSSGVSHAYVRSKTGKFTVFDAPGAGTGSGQGTKGVSVNGSGQVSGTYSDANGALHGFIRTP